MRIEASEPGITRVHTMLTGDPEIPIPTHKLSGTGVEPNGKGMRACLNSESIALNHGGEVTDRWGLE